MKNMATADKQLREVIMRLTEFGCLSSHRHLRRLAIREGFVKTNQTRAHYLFSLSLRRRFTLYELRNSEGCYWSQTAEPAL